MEGAAAQSDLSNPDETLNPALQEKHQSMIDRLSARHQVRLSNSSSNSASSSPPFESTSSFLTRFSDLKRSIESQLAECRTISAADPPRLKSHLSDISASICSMEKLVADNSYFLPSYEIRSSLKTISDMKQNFDVLNLELLPKKKFSFKNKSAAKKPDLVTQPDIETPHSISKPDFAIRDSPGFRRKQNEVLVQNFKGLEIGEFTIADLDSCEVRLFGCVNALFVHRLRNCKVYAGPVTGSILMEDVEECVFALASHQMRIHYAKGCDFYLRVRSRPIIEDSSGVRFAPYCLRYKGIEEDLKEAGLDEETSNWANVDDFRWLRAAQSPNWSVLAEGERLGSVEMMELESGNGDN